MKMKHILTYKLLTEGKGKDRRKAILKSYEDGFNKIVKDLNIDFGVIDDMLLDFQDEVTSLIVSSDKYYSFNYGRNSNKNTNNDDAINLPFEEDFYQDYCAIDDCCGFYKALRNNKLRVYISYNCQYELSDKFITLYNNGKYKKFFDQIELRCASEHITFNKELYSNSGYNCLYFWFIFPLNKSSIKDPAADVFHDIPKSHINQLLNFTYDKKFTEEDNVKLASIIRNIIKSKNESINEAKKMKVNYDEFFKLNYENFQNILVKNNIDTNELDDITLNLRDELNVNHIGKREYFYINIPQGRNLTLQIDHDAFTNFEDNYEKANQYRQTLEFFTKHKILRSVVEFKYTMHIGVITSGFDKNKFDHDISDDYNKNRKQVLPFFEEIKSRCESIGYNLKYWTSYNGISLEFSCSLDKSTILNPNEIPLDKGKLSKDLDLKLGDLMARKRFTQKDKEDLMSIINSISNN